MTKTNPDSCCCCKDCVCDPSLCELTLESYEAATCIADKEIAKVINKKVDFVGRANTNEAQCCDSFMCVCNPEFCRQPVVEVCKPGFVKQMVKIAEDVNGEAHNCCT